MAYSMTREAALAQYEHITSIDKYFRINPDESWTFIGDTLHVRIPKRYEVHGFLDIGDTVKTLAMIDLVFDEKYRAGLMAMCQIEMDNSGLSEIIIDGITYLVVTLNKGDKFMYTSTIVRNKDIVTAIFSEYIDMGKRIFWLDYRQTFHLFDQAKAVADASLNFDHVLFEFIYAHLARDQDDLTIPYRHTDQKKLETMIGLSNVPFGTDSATAKLLGSYPEIGLNSALTTDPTKSSTPEDLLRR